MYCGNIFSAPVIFRKLILYICEEYNNKEYVKRTIEPFQRPFPISFLSSCLPIPPPSPPFQAPSSRSSSTNNTLLGRRSEPLLQVTISWRCLISLLSWIVVEQRARSLTPTKPRCRDIKTPRLIRTRDAQPWHQQEGNGGERGGEGTKEKQENSRKMKEPSSTKGVFFLF